MFKKVIITMLEKLLNSYKKDNLSEYDLGFIDGVGVCIEKIQKL